jgi:hypothetical protein
VTNISGEMQSSKEDARGWQSDPQQNKWASTGKRKECRGDSKGGSSNARRIKKSKREVCQTNLV